MLYNLNIFSLLPDGYSYNSYTSSQRFSKIVWNDLPKQCLSPAKRWASWLVLVKVTSFIARPLLQSALVPKLTKSSKWNKKNKKRIAKNTHILVNICICWDPTIATTISFFHPEMHLFLFTVLFFLHGDIFCLSCPQGLVPWKWHF